MIRVGNLIGYFAAHFCITCGHCVGMWDVGYIFLPVGFLRHPQILLVVS